MIMYARYYYKCKKYHGKTARLAQTDQYNRIGIYSLQSWSTLPVVQRDLSNFCDIQYGSENLNRVRKTSNLYLKTAVLWFFYFFYFFNQTILYLVRKKSSKNKSVFPYSLHTQINDFYILVTFVVLSSFSFIILSKASLCLKTFLEK